MVVVVVVLGGVDNKEDAGVGFEVEIGVEVVLVVVVGIGIGKEKTLAKSTTKTLSTNPSAKALFPPEESANLASVWEMILSRREIGCATSSATNAAPVLSTASMAMAVHADFSKKSGIMVSGPTSVDRDMM